MTKNKRPSNRKLGSIFAGLLLIFLILAGDIITGAVSSHAPTTIADPKTTIQCANGQFATNVTESAKGVLTLNCTRPVLPTHVHTPNVLTLALPSFVGVPFTTTSTTAVVVPGLLVGPVRQQNATHGFWLLILAQLTVKISAGIGNIQLECDGATCGSGGSFSNTNYQTVSIFIMQNNTFTDNLTHTIGVDISSDNAAHTVTVCAIDTDCFATGLGNYVTLLSVADLSSAPPI